MSIVKVGCGEYRTVYLHDDGTVGTTAWNGKYSYMKYGIKDVVDVAGGQYTCLAWTKDGVAYELGQNSQGGPMATKYTLPRPVAYGQMLYQAILLVDDQGAIYYVANSTSKDNDALRLGTKSTPYLLQDGGGVSKIVGGQPEYGMLFLTNNGEVFIWAQGKLIPLKVIDSGAIDIAMIGRGVYVMNTGTELKIWGPRCDYAGSQVKNIGTPTTLTTPAKFPLKKMIGNWNTLHIIDDNNDMWAIGENIMGEIGNGEGCRDWKNYKNGTTPQPFAWNWLPAQMLTNRWVKLDGKWSDVFTSGSMAFYLYATDMKGQLYSWGRNKKRALGNGRTLPDNDLDVKYPNWEDQHYPTRVYPDQIKEWTVVTKFDPATAPNNALFTPIPPDPIPEPPVPTKKKLATTIVGNYQFDLYDNGTSESKAL